MRLLIFPTFPIAWFEPVRLLISKLSDYCPITCSKPVQFLLATLSVCSIPPRRVVPDYLKKKKLFGIGERTTRTQSPVMENLNTPQELDRLKTTVLRQLQTLQGAPGVQMIEVSVNDTAVPGIQL